MIDEFDRVTKALIRIGAEMEASEAHGLLCGLLCKNGNDGRDWLEQVMGEADSQDLLVKESRQTLLDLYEVTMEQLEGESFDLRLLLRKDEDPIEDRIDDLVHWCHGFLSGLAQIGVKDFKKMPESVREVLEDLLEISKVGYQPGDDEEENEEAYTEIVEYIRVGVMLIFTELNIGADGQGAPTIH